MAEPSWLRCILYRKSCRTCQNQDTSRPQPEFPCTARSVVGPSSDNCLGYRRQWWRRTKSENCFRHNRHSSTALSSSHTGAAAAVEDNDLPVAEPAAAEPAAATTGTTCRLRCGLPTGRGDGMQATRITERAHTTAIRGRGQGRGRGRSGTCCMHSRFRRSSSSSTYESACERLQMSPVRNYRHGSHLQALRRTIEHCSRIGECRYRWDGREDRERTWILLAKRWPWKQGSASQHYAPRAHAAALSAAHALIKQPVLRAVMLAHTQWRLCIIAGLYLAMTVGTAGKPRARRGLETAVRISR